MKVTSSELWAPEPGTIWSWQVAAGGQGVPAQLSLNQRNHLAGALGGEPTVWLAAAFDVDGPLDREALTAAWQTLVERHSSLQLEVTVEDGAPLGWRHRPSGMRWSADVLARTESIADTRSILVETIAKACQPWGFPAFAPLAIDRGDSATIVLAMDHLHCDAWSIAIVVEELSALYGGAGLLPETACFLTWIERTSSSPVRVWHDDPRLQSWHSFLRQRDFALPTFPLDLGVPAGVREAQATATHPLVDAAGVERISARAAAVDGSTFSAVMACLATAIADLGGGDRLETLAPVSTRNDDTTRRSIGWYGTTVPLEIEAGVDDGALAAAGRAIKHALTLAPIPLDEVLGSMPAPLVRTRSDVFMVSWIDYRRLPGRAREAQHISASTLADDVQFWLSRTDEGIAVRVRFPETATAQAVIARLLVAWRQRLAEVAQPLAAPDDLPHPRRLEPLTADA